MWKKFLITLIMSLLIVFFYNLQLFCTFTFVLAIYLRILYGYIMMVYLLASITAGFVTNSLFILFTCILTLYGVYKPNFGLCLISLWIYILICFISAGNIFYISLQYKEVSISLEKAASFIEISYKAILDHNQENSNEICYLFEKVFCF